MTNYYAFFRLVVRAILKVDVFRFFSIFYVRVRKIKNQKIRHFFLKTLEKPMENHVFCYFQHSQPLKQGGGVGGAGFL